MTDQIQQPYPPDYNYIMSATEKAGFTMASDPLTGSLLCSLAASKPGGTFLELGTGTGLSTSWLLHGMDKVSSLISVDNDQAFLTIAKGFLDHDLRLQLICSDGESWLRSNSQMRYDFIFADTWHGKYLLLEETLQMLKPGGLYVIDDMLPQPNWPEGHDKKALKLMEELEGRQDLLLTKLTWSTGIVIATKKA